MGRKLAVSLALIGVCLAGAVGSAVAHVVTFAAPDANHVKPGIQVRAGAYLTEPATFMFLAQSPLQESGQIIVKFPASWSAPSTMPGYSGYCTITTTSTASLTLNTTGQLLLVTVLSGNIKTGEQLFITYQQANIQWYTQDNVKIPVYAKYTSTATALSVLFPTVIDVVAGPPANLTFDNWGLTVQRGVATLSPVRVKLMDSNWIATAATAAVTVNLSGVMVAYDSATYCSSYQTDTSAAFSLTQDFSQAITSVTIAAGETGAAFYYRTSANVTNTCIRVEHPFSYAGGMMTSDMWVTVLQGGITNARIHRGDYVSAQSLTVSAGERAYIDFNLVDANVSWQVLVSSSADYSNPLWTYWGWGLPVQGQVSWDGTVSYYDYSAGYNRNEKAPNGTYYVRIQLGNTGGIKDDSLSVTLQSLEIAGRITDETGAGVPDVSVSAYGPAYAYTMSDANGYYRLAGLRAGSYNLNCWKQGYVYFYTSGITAGSEKNILMTHPTYLKLRAHRTVSDTITDQELWGNVQLIPVSGGGNSYWGSFHFAVDVSTSDNGQWVSDQTIPRYELDNSTAMYTAGKWTVLEVAPGAYTLRAELYGYETWESGPITISSGTTLELTNIQLTLKKTVYGTVQLPAACTDAWGSWVSIEAIPDGSSYSSAWGSAQIPWGASSGTYVITGLAAGAYTLRASAPGYRKKSAALTITASDLIMNAPAMTLDTGGVLTGTVRVEGNTTDTALNLSDPYTLYLNAWSPETYGYGWTQVQLQKHISLASTTFTIAGLEDGAYWINAWMNGFELDGCIGWNGIKATVSGGSGSCALTFKRYSGRVRATIAVPSNDYANLQVSINGTNMWINDIAAGSFASYGIQFDAETGRLTTPPLGTGFYQIKARYTGTGLEKTKSVMVVNGQTTDISIDLTGNTYTVSGVVQISPSNPPQGITDIAVLISTAGSVAVRLSEYSNLSTVTGTASYYNAKTCYITDAGSFSISGVVPGIYTLSVDAMNFDGNWSNGNETAKTEKVLVVQNDCSGEILEISKGYTVRGQVKLPAGETATRDMTAYVYRASEFSSSKYTAAGNLYTSVSFANANSANYEIRGLAPGSYVIVVPDYGYSDPTTYSYVPRQYANASVTVKIGSSDLSGQNIQLSKGGTISFKLRDAGSGTVITPGNKDKMLPIAYTMSVQANPWIEGGYGTLAYSTGTSSQENFEMKYLPEASYDLMLGQSSYGYYGIAGTASSSGNTSSYAAKTVSAISVTNGQTKDLGIIDINQGMTISGTVSAADGTGIPNIPVIALPSLSNEWSSQLRGFTDINGKYSIVGLNPEYPYYDIIACPRVDPSNFGGYYFYGAGGLSYGEKVRSMVKIADATAVDFTLSRAYGTVSGRIVTEDGGALENMDDANLPTAKVFMQLEDTFPRTNPVGDIQENTDITGAFEISALPAGTYKLVVLSGGYASVSRTVVVTDTAVDLGTITLRRGARISGTITKLNGKNPSTAEVLNICAANEDFSEILVGTLETSGDKTVIGYELNGFQPGIVYNILFLGESDEMIPALENFSVPLSTYTKTDLDLTYHIGAPAVFSRARRTAGVFTISFELTGALRNTLPADNDLSAIISLSAGNGTLANAYLAPNRKSLTCTYTPPANENKFAVRLQAYAKAVNAATGSEFLIDETFEYYAGVGAKNRAKVSNLKGGKIALDGDTSNVQFSPGAFETTTSTTSIYVDFSRADSLADIKVAAPGRGAPCLALPRAAQAYPDVMYRAIQAAQTAGVEPFSSFYDIMLPAGVSRVLKKDATLTLQYAGNVDPSTLNIYYYDPETRVYLKEAANRQADATEQTISVSISHASIFVILQSNAASIQGTAYNGPLYVYNYPNPFSLDQKSITLVNAAAAQQAQTIAGTMFHYALPVDVSGEVVIKIYTVAGELVRTINDGVKTGGSHYYVAWDGANDAGKKAASGVYLARFTVDGKQEKIMKLAIIK